MRIFRLLAVASSLFAWAGLAEAVPLYFDFTGTVTSVAWSIPGSWPDAEDEIGKQVSGGFTFETDALVPYYYPNPVPQQSFLEFARNNALLSTAYVTLGAEEIDVLPYPTSYADINFIDACNPSPGSCDNSWVENFNLYANSSEHPFAPGFTGTYRTRSLSFSSVIPYDPWNPDAPRLNYFDVSQGIDPFAIATLPLYSLHANYSEYAANCVDDDCSWTYGRQWLISIDSVSRGVHGVPEPGTLGLFSLSIFAAAFAVRARKRSSAIQ